MKLVAVNGRKYAKEILLDAVKESPAQGSSLELLSVNGEFFKTYRIDYHGGPRYPYLERDGTKPDLLSGIIRPLLPAREARTGR